MSLIPVLFRWPLVLLPVHIVFLELIIDPACSVVFEAEPEEADVMTRPPRRPDAPLFGKRTVILSLLQGTSVLAMLLLVYVISLNRGQSEVDSRALTFTTLIIANLGLIFVNRSWSRTVLATLRSPNTALWWVTGGAILFLGMALYVPFLRDLFRFSFLHPIDILICVVAGVASVLWFEVLKIMSARRGQPAKAGP
jgi:Ca2+-transporting ATPase